MAEALQLTKQFVDGRRKLVADACTQLAFRVVNQGRAQAYAGSRDIITIIEEYLGMQQPAQSQQPASSQQRARSFLPARSQLPVRSQQPAASAVGGDTAASRPAEPSHAACTARLAAVQAQLEHAQSVLEQERKLKEESQALCEAARHMTRDVPRLHLELDDCKQHIATLEARLAAQQPGVATQSVEIQTDADIVPQQPSVATRSVEIQTDVSTSYTAAYDHPVHFFTDADRRVMADRIARAAEHDYYSLWEMEVELTNKLSSDIQQRDDVIEQLLDQGHVVRADSPADSLPYSPSEHADPVSQVVGDIVDSLHADTLVDNDPPCVPTAAASDGQQAGPAAKGRKRKLTGDTEYGRVGTENQKGFDKRSKPPRPKGYMYPPIGQTVSHVGKECRGKALRDMCFSNRGTIRYKDTQEGYRWQSQDVCSKECYELLKE